ncbi:protein-L-isoaspartate(D-aspartate) O-methyltransferase [Actinokineospora baliensis]|uniref:methyltransferase, FxLD system n=1 Tax=Actinokineospora baliensis TaxID=547056 RepID=UPI00195759F8|nr:methyltransferase, FxLD system [Actinokineospora baliensis]MBM7776007.1 protein-L-isoaspartate(D-aspartate) O-methyltransferase [Actinokineospora baliensis]
MSTLRDNDVDVPGRLRAAMVGALREMGAIRSDQVADALLAVPRHLFAPVGESLERVYDPTTVIVTKRDEQGAAISSLSEAHIQATMLEQAGIEPGMRVLEIGTGGYNASLIAELVGDTGTVVSVDIDSDIVAGARDCLAWAGYDRVIVVEADAEHGVGEYAPFDRVIVTAGAWDIPPAWSRQLTEHGRIVVPLRLRGMTRSIAFERDGDRLASLSHRLCGFVPMQGEGTHTERLVHIDGDQVAIRVDGDQDIDPELLRTALHSPRVEHWSGVEFDHIDGMDLFVGTTAPGFALLYATKPIIDSGLVGPAAIRGVPTAVRGGSFAYRTKRPVEGTGTFETGVLAHGPDADALAQEYVAWLRTWDRDHRNGTGPLIEVHPAGTPDSELGSGLVVDKVHTRVVISWP